MKLLKAMAIAFSIYSKIPVPQFEWKEEDMEYMMCFFPWIGGVIGLFFFGWAVLCEKFAVGNVCYALIGAAIPLMISGGFHVDGYMDTMDAFHSYQSREKKLEILKDSHIGAFAAIMLALYYMIDIAAISEIHTQKAVSALAAVFFLARCFSGIAVMTLQPAKKEGLLYTFASSAQKVRVKQPYIFRQCFVWYLCCSYPDGMEPRQSGRRCSVSFILKRKVTKSLVVSQVTRPDFL